MRTAASAVSTTNGGSQPARVLELLGTGTILGITMLLSGCSHGSAAAQQKKAVEVVVTTPITDEVTDFQDFTGRLEAVKMVEIRARVSGYANEIPFKEGDEIKERSAVQIDPRTSRRFHQAEANLPAEADRKLLEKNAARARHIGSKAIGKEEFDQIHASLKAAATVMPWEPRGPEQTVRGFTASRPQQRRISRRPVDPGNLVNADNTALTTIVTVNRMYAYF